MLSFLISHSPLFYFTQSLWRDEVYSVFMAAKPIGYFVNHLNFEPPFYYLVLHFWMKIFGMSEIAGRSLSFLAFAGATVVVIYWAEKLFKRSFLSWWLPLFFFLNPMLIYYGVELRTYGFYIFFATLSLYAYWSKRWTLWIVATALGFYTHSFLIIVPFAQTIHYGLTHLKKLKFDSFVKSLLIFGAFIAPWGIKVGLLAGSLKSSWYFPVDFHLVKSVLGNLFVGYEGTPWYLWNFTRILSVIILLLSIVALIPKKTRETVGLFLTQLFIPLAVVIGISFIKPFYVNRYMIPATIAEIFIVAFAIHAIKQPIIQKSVALVCLLFVLGFNAWYPSRHPKGDMRAVLHTVNALLKPGDVIIADNPLVIFESMYYAKPGTKVFLYNPKHVAFPIFVGEGLVSSDQMIDRFPSYPTRGFLIHQGGTFEIVYSLSI